MDEMSDHLSHMAPRRCFLFAGYSPDGTVDEADRFHIANLKRFGDVYVCLDGAIVKTDELAPHVKHVMARPHGEYDFGSWKRLIRHIGWNALDAYDEVVFVNNSVILVGDLAPVLCAASRSSARFFAPVFLDEHYIGPAVHLRDYLARTNVYYQSAMFSSFLWVLKRELIREPFFHDFILGVKRQPHRIDVCYEYERGFTRSLLRHGVSYEVFIERVFKMSYIYTADAFALVDRGLPYLKRKIFSQGYYNIPFLEARVKGFLQRVRPEAADIVQRQLLASRKVRP
jgi:lipopolysaccharide biosynthesis protein